MEFLICTYKLKVKAEKAGSATQSAFSKRQLLYPIKNYTACLMNSGFVVIARRKK
jgi:hypothetical protein